MSKKLQLNRNEVIQGPSPKILKVIRNFPIKNMSSYYDGYFGSDLVTKLTKIYNLPSDQIIVGFGLEDILRIIFESLNPNTDVVLTHEPHYTYYEKYLNFKKVKLEKFNLIKTENSFIFDVDQCVKKINIIKPSVVLITSPNNPTGNSISFEEFKRILSAANKKTLVVLDEAYFGFDKNYKENEFIDLLSKHDNLMILRSFSKLYALAGLRIGFALCGKRVLQILGYQRYYLGGSRLLEAIGIAALESKTYYRKISEVIIQDRENLISKANKIMGVKAYKSNANFVLIEIDKKIKKHFEIEAEKLDFSISKFVFDNCMRVTIGSKKYTNKFLEMLHKFN